MSITIIPNAIPRSLCFSAKAAWPNSLWPHWHRYDGKNANKFGSVDRCRIPPACIAAIDALALAAIPHIGDSFIDYDLHAAGLHMLPPGGFLGRHLDAECHPIRPWRRTHSIVLSLNENWDQDWGGQLVIDDSLEIFPTMGSMVIFSTDQRWHEVKSVSANGQNRTTLAIFAWTQSDNYSGNTCAEFKS